MRTSIGIIVGAISVVVLGLVMLGNNVPRKVANTIWHPGYGACGRCARTWDIAQGHDTPYGNITWNVITPEGDFGISIAGVPNDGWHHLVTVTNGSQCFPLCEQCWRALKTPKARLPYYRKLLDGWKKGSPENAAEQEAKWQGMKSSVEAGL